MLKKMALSSTFVIARRSSWLALETPVHGSVPKELQLLSCLVSAED